MVDYKGSMIEVHKLEGKRPTFNALKFKQHYDSIKSQARNSLSDNKLEIRSIEEPTVTFFDVHITKVMYRSDLVPKHLEGQEEVTSRYNL